MFDRDRWQEILIAIKQNKLRSVLTAFGVFWGIFMLVTMTGAGNGLINGVTAGFRNFATNSGFIWTQSTTEPYKGFKRGRYWNFRNSDLEAIRQNIPEVELLAPKLQGWNISGGENVIRGLKTGSYTIYGEVPEYNIIDPNEMIYGRFINQKDIDDRRKVCVIGERVYEVMFEKDENPVGQYIRLSGVWFQVIGVAKPINTNISYGSDKRETIYIPLTTMQQTFNHGDVVHMICFTAKKGESVSKVVDKIEALVKERHSISPTDKEAVMKINIEEQIKQISYLFIGIGALIWIVGIGTLIAGAVGISNIMLVVVKERTKEIGVQRAIGARPWTIVSQILTESVFLTTIAGFIGLALGTLVLHLADLALTVSQASSTEEQGAFFRHPEIGLGLALSALAVLVVTGFLAGLIPAQKAVRIKPIEALRHE